MRSKTGWTDPNRYRGIKVPCGVQPADSRDPIPAGRYVAAIVKSHIQANRNRAGNVIKLGHTGYILKLTWEVLDGPHKGRKIWANLDIVHQNHAAQETGQGELKSICDAVRFASDLDDSAQLHNRPCVIAVKVTPPKDGYDAKNEISGYAPVAGPVAGFARVIPFRLTRRRDPPGGPIDG